VNGSEVSVPLSVRLRFGHAAIQHLADAVGVDVLHIKGAAVDPSLRPGGYTGSDVDVMVRPSRVANLDAALRSHGWRLYTTFTSGSPFGHAQTYLHDAWGYVDVHRAFPGIRVAPDAAFERLWAAREPADIAGVRCAVPDLVGQSLLLILNAARSRAPLRHDLAAVWTSADDDRRAAIRSLVAELHAEVAFAAATGELERYRHAREYRLWKVVSSGGSRSEEWWARVRAAPDLGEALRVVARAPLVNVDHLAARLGRHPTRREIVVEFFDRPVRALGEAWRGLHRSGARR
jgi:hypothetical protein